MKFWFGFLVLLAVFAEEIYPTYSRLNQMSITAGMIPDQQADTFSMNPASGDVYTHPEFSLYNVTNGTSLSGVPCLYSQRSTITCPYFDMFSLYLLLQYVHPVTEKFGFFLGVAPYAGFSQYQTPLQGVLSGNVATGFWYSIKDDIILGINFTNRMSDIASLGDSTSGLSEFAWHFSMSPGIRYNPGDIDMGYSIIFSDILLNQINPSYLIVTVDPLAVNTDSQELFLIHHFYFRFPLSDDLKINSIISLQHNSLDFQGVAASYFEFYKEYFKIYAGMEYYLKSIHMDFSENARDQVFYNNLINIRTGFDVKILAWLDIRAGIKLFSYDFISLNSSNSQSISTFEIRPLLTGGLKFNFSVRSALEVNLQQEGFTFSAIQPGLNLFIQYNVKFGQKGSGS